MWISAEIQKKIKWVTQKSIARVTLKWWKRQLKKKTTECVVQMYRPLKVRKEGAESAFKYTYRLVYLATYIRQGVRVTILGRRLINVATFKFLFFNSTRLIFIAIPC